MVYWPQRVFAVVGDVVSEQVSGFLHGGAIARRAEELQDAHAASEQYKNQIELLERQIAELRKLADMGPISNYKKHGAVLLGYFPTQHRLMLDVGGRNGVKLGDPVVSPGGLVGQVVEVSTASCFVNLVTNLDFSVGARVVRAQSEEVGIAHGQSSDQMLLSVYQENAKLLPGDLISTSGLSTIYPEGISIGRVTKTWHNKNLGIQQALVQPEVELSTLRYAVVLTK
ncbi:MAG: rod shape-determining protein MreC [Fimbriimonadales bacterium]